VIPKLAYEDKLRSVGPLRELLILRGVVADLDQEVAGQRVPLVIRLAGGDVCVDVHHPLVDPTLNESAVVSAARSQFFEVVSLNAFELEHDLPAAVGHLALPTEGAL